MSTKGLVKAKKVNWQETNVSLFGSDTDRTVKKEAAESEPAWEGAGKDVGLQVWRIEKFKPVVQKEHGTFYKGDSYIVLNTYKEKGSEELNYDLHFWIGKESTQDEYGTAAYKTVELDTLLDDKPIQHREVQAHESQLFMSYFKGGMITMEGGIESGFRHVTDAEYKPCLYQAELIGKPKSECLKLCEVPYSKKSLSRKCVMILDLGLNVYQLNGDGQDYKMGRNRYMITDLASKRFHDRDGRVKVEVNDWDDLNDENNIFNTLPDGDDDFQDGQQTVEEEDDCDTFEPCLFRISEDSGEVEFKKMELRSIPRKEMENDVYLLDTGRDALVNFGRRCSDKEECNALLYAERYLRTTKHPFIPISACPRRCEPSEAFKIEFKRYIAKGYY